MSQATVVESTIPILSTWFLIVLLFAELAIKLWLNPVHQFGIVENHDIYEDISDRQRKSALSVASLVIAGLAIILSEQPGDITQPVEVLAGAFGLLLMAAFAHELTRTRRFLLTFQEIALEYGLLMMVYGLYLLVKVFVADASQVMLIIFVAVLAFRLYSVKGELEAHQLEFRYSDYDTRWEFFWDAIRKHEFTYLRKLYSFRATVTILALISGVYFIQLWIAGSTDYAAAYSVTQSLSPPEFLLGSPWFHSDHSHILWNAGMFTVFGWWMEKRIDSRNLFGGAILIGYVANLFPYFIGFGGAGLGASGITHAFQTFFAGAQITQAARLYHSEPTPVLKLVVHTSLFLFVGFLMASAFIQALGFLPAPDGTATGAHAIGIVMGLIWFFIQNIEYRFTWPPGFKLLVLQTLICEPSVQARIDRPAN